MSDQRGKITFTFPVTHFTAREATAYHEAGHAVAAFLELDTDAVYSVTIKPDDEAGLLGRVKHRGLGFDFDEQDERALGSLTEYAQLAQVIKRITVALAGGEAEREHTGQATGTESDDQLVAQLAVKVCGSERETRAFVTWLRVRTAALVKLESTQAVIRAVAEALLERETLTGDEVAQIACQSVLARAKADKADKADKAEGSAL